MVSTNKKVHSGNGKRIASVVDQDKVKNTVATGKQNEVTMCDPEVNKAPFEIANGEKNGESQRCNGDSIG